MTLDPKRWNAIPRGPWRPCGLSHISTLDGRVVARVDHTVESQGRDAVVHLIADAPALAAAYVRLTAEDARLREALTIARDFVTDKRHGTVKYYEGSDVYEDLERVRVVIDAALSGDAS